MTSRIGSLVWRQQVLAEVLAGTAASSFVVLVAWRLGLLPATALAALIATLALAVTSPRTLAVVILVLAPLPSIGALIGITIPVGLDPLNVLVLLGAVLAAQMSAGSGTRRLGGSLLAVAVGLNLGLLLVAWFRTYGQEQLTGASAALFVKPVVVVIAALVIIRLLPRQVALRTVAIGMAVLLVGTSVSLILQRLGLYSTIYQEQNVMTTSVKQYGGLMLTGNGAGLLVGVFSVPAFLLLRYTGHRVLAAVVLTAAVPALLVSVSRGGIVAFTAGLLALIVLERRRAVGLRVATVLVVGGTAWALTAGQAETELIQQRYDANDLNTTLSGRVEIWEQVGLYMRDDPSRWVVGGGLHDFREFALGTSLRQDIPTHSTFLTALTDGGLVMLAAFVLGVFALARLSWTASPPIGTALMIALVSAVVMGLSLSLTLFAREASWLWVLAALAWVFPREPPKSSRRGAALESGGHPPADPAAKLALGLYFDAPTTRPPP